MRIVILLLFCAVGLSAKENIHRADFQGRGEVKAKPDFIKLNINIRSLCYENPKKAQRATDKSVQQIYDFLSNFERPKDKFFKILVDGGYTTAYFKWLYRNKKSIKICNNTFQKNTQIIFKIGAHKDFDKDFGEIQQFVLDKFAQGLPVDSYESSFTYVTLNMPEPRITPAHRAKLEKKALHLAMLDAKANFRAVMQSCREHQWKIIDINQSGKIYPSPSPSPRFYAKSVSMSSMGAAESQDQALSAPVRFDDLKISKILSVTFQFEGAMCYEK